MKIGLSFINQISNLLIPKADPIAMADLSAQERADQNGGGWIASQIRELVAQVAAGYHTQHNDDDTHKTITATGAISERSRTTPMGEWISVALDASRFSGSGSMTWTPAPVNGNGLAYMLVGKTMFVRWNLLTSVGGVASTVLNLKVHDTFRPASGITTQVPFNYGDNGTTGTGNVVINPYTTGNGVLLQFTHLPNTTNWALSTANTSLVGEVFFEVA
jgi:hypothetical protein